MAIDVRGKLSLDGSLWEAGLRKAESSTGRFANSTLGALKSRVAAAFAVTAITAYAKSVVDLGGKIQDTAERWDISPEAVQKFQYAVEQSGGSIEDVEAALKKLAIAKAELDRNPNSKLVGAFKQLGIEAKEVANLRLEDLFLRVADSIRDAEDPQQKMAYALQLLGKSGSALFPAMRGDIRALSEEAERLGLVLGNQAIKELDDWGDAWQRNLKKIQVGVGNILAGIFGLFDDIDSFTQIFALANKRVQQKESGEGEFAKMTDSEWNDFFFKESQRIINRDAKVRPKTTSSQTTGDTTTGQDQHRAAEEAARLNAQASEVERRNRLDAMDAETKRLTIQKEITAEIAKQAVASDILGDDVKTAESRLKIAKLQAELAGIPKEEPQKPPLAQRDFSRPNDSLIRVGNFLGVSGQSSVVAIGQKQVSLLSSIDKGVGKLVSMRGSTGETISQYV